MNYLKLNGSNQVSIEKYSPDSFKINNTYIEDMVDGYQTIEVIRQLPTITNDVADNPSDNKLFKYRKISDRSFEVSFYIKGNGNDTDSHTKVSNLGSILYSLENKALVFKNEPDITYFAYSTETNIESFSKQGDVFGKFTLIMLDPFRYLKPKTLMGNNSVVNITLNNKYKSTNIKQNANKITCFIKDSSNEFLLKNSENGKNIRLFKSVKMGDKVEIDFKKYVIMLNSSNVLSSMDWKSDLEDFYFYEGSVISTNVTSEIVVDFNQAII